MEVVWPGVDQPGSSTFVASHHSLTSIHVTGDNTNTDGCTLFWMCYRPRDW